MVISTIFDLMKRKRILYLLIGMLLCFNTNTNGQIRRDTIKPKRTDTVKPKHTDTVKVERTDTVKVKVPTSVGTDTIRDNVNRKTLMAGGRQKAYSAKDSAPGKTKQDSLLPEPIASATADTGKNKIESDSLPVTASSPEKSSGNITSKVLLNNQMINTKDRPVYFIEEARQAAGKEFLFYALCGILLILGIFKTFYSNYFNNLFRVFFNTSLRQIQLTDQLLQAKLPSFILNIFFTLTTGIYISLLFMHFHPTRIISGRLLLPFCIVTVAVLYLIKYSLLKFMGWVSDIRQATDSYIFVIFLINKITGILLVPFIILLAFSVPQWINAITMISLSVLGLFFLSRYIKSYAVVQKKISLNAFHFIIYIAGAEIIPIMLIYKVAVDYLI